MPLESDLEQFRQEFLAKFPKEKAAVMARADDELAARQVTKHAVRTGDLAPDFVLPDATGRPISLADTLRYGPAIVVFYRGGWCPYCNLELRAYQRLLPEIRAGGGQLIAVSPQSPDASLSTQEKNALAFPVLSDVTNAAAKAFGILFELPTELRDLYTTLGHGLDGINASREWVLPVPATYVVAPDGRVAAHHVEIDYRTRMEPRAALDVVKSVAARAVQAAETKGLATTRSKLVSSESA